MKKYKLIKSYPGSPKLGTEVNYSENNKIYNYNGGDFYSELPKHQVENLPEYWEEIIEKNYEILSFRGKISNLIYELTNSGHYKPKFCQAYYKTEKQALNDKNVEIHKVKRLSDGEIFKVGDKFSFLDGSGNNIIEEFKIDNGLRVIYNKYPNGNGYWSDPLCNIRHIKKPLFTTEDGVDIFKDDYYYGLENNYKDIWLKIVRYVGITKPNGIKQFSTKEAAEEYILMNKPCLSVNDIININYNPIETRTSTTNKLKELVKSKL